MMLQEKTVLVTGASSGIGRDCALSLARQGAHIILLASNGKKLASLADEFKMADLPTPTLCPFDLLHATSAHYAGLAVELEQQFEQLDGLIHAAGRLEKLVPLEHTPALQWQSIIQINLNARFLLTEACMNLLKKAPAARLLFLLSEKATQSGQAHWGSYQVAEQGTRTLFEVLSQELEHSSILVNALTLPPCDTPLRRRAYPFEDQSKLSQPNELDGLWTELFKEDIAPPHGSILTHA